VVFVAICALIAYEVERDFGRLEVTRVAFATDEGPTMVGKLYRHREATAENQMPGVLALHGYQNDKETAAPYALELARRGFVTLAIDHLGHGSSGGAMDWETASGSNSGYWYLKGLPFVDADNLGILGHSMGAINTLILAGLNPGHRALNPQCGTAGTMEFNNLLLTQARYEEFRYFRENELLVGPLEDHQVRIEAFGLESGPVEWNTTYGDFDDGTARRADLLDTVHVGITHSSEAVSGTLTWMRQALKGGREDAFWIPERDQVFMERPGLYVERVPDAGGPSDDSGVDDLSRQYFVIDRVLRPGSWAAPRASRGGRPGLVDSGPGQRGHRRRHLSATHKPGGHRWQGHHLGALPQDADHQRRHGVVRGQRGDLRRDLHILVPQEQPGQGHHHVRYGGLV
jgi:hypothetical protein